MIWILSLALLPTMCPLFRPQFPHLYFRDINIDLPWWEPTTSDSLSEASVPGFKFQFCYFLSIWSWVNYWTFLHLVSSIFKAGLIIVLCPRVVVKMKWRIIQKVSLGECGGPGKHYIALANVITMLTTGPGEIPKWVDEACWSHPGLQERRECRTGVGHLFL